MRGKLEAIYGSLSEIGITPAGAGKTLTKLTNCCIIKDHPRRCGENKDFSAYTHRPPGSPPQVRGKQINNFFNVIVLRITPAGAGKTDAPAQVALENEDHPRRCGENFDGLIIHPKQIGSPPQVRGKLLSTTALHAAARITPAGAGKTCGQKRQQPRFRDHPRRCGENTFLPTSSKTKTGSPPQVRGKQTHLLRLLIGAGITPAGAGKTSIKINGDKITVDHPRRCGENCYTSVIYSIVKGSPPQVRGKRKVNIIHAASVGITPAGAGKTHDYAEARYWRRDHPRRCGENSAKARVTRS